jgi:hypothetical protein
VSMRIGTSGGTGARRGGGGGAVWILLPPPKEEAMEAAAVDVGPPLPATAVPSLRSCDDLGGGGCLSSEAGGIGSAIGSAAAAAL